MSNRTMAGASASAERPKTGNTNGRRICHNFMREADDPAAGIIVRCITILSLISLHGIRPSVACNEQAVPGRVNNLKFGLGPPNTICLWWTPPGNFTTESPLSYEIIYTATLGSDTANFLLGPFQSVNCDNGLRTGQVLDTPRGVCSAAVQNLNVALNYKVRVAAVNCVGAGPSDSTNTVIIRNSSNQLKFCQFNDAFALPPPPSPPPPPPLVSPPPPPPSPPPPFTCGSCPSTIVAEQCLPAAAPPSPLDSSLGPSGTACLSFSIPYPFAPGQALNYDPVLLINGVIVEVLPFNATSESFSEILLNDVIPGIDVQSNFSFVIRPTATVTFLDGSIVIGGLTDGVPYTFRYQFLNCVGAGEPSPISTDFFVPFPTGGACRAAGE